MLFLGPPVWIFILLLTSAEPVYTPQKPKCVSYSDHGLQVSFLKMWEIMQKGVDVQGFEDNWVMTGAVFEGKVLWSNKMSSINRSF